MSNETKTKKKKPHTRSVVQRTIAGKDLVRQIKAGGKVNPSDAMRNAGYTESYINGPGKRLVMDSDEVKGELAKLEEFLEQTDTIIQSAMRDAPRKQADASFKDNISAIVELTKLQRLVKGESTENQAVIIGRELDALEV